MNCSIITANWYLQDSFNSKTMKIKIYTFAILTLLIFNAQAQKSKVAYADKKYDSYAYVDAIKTYESVARKGYKDEKMFQRLGNAYYFNANLAQAAKWYDELFAMNANQIPEYYYRYSQTLRSLGNYAKADKMLDEFNTKSGNDKRAKLYQGHKNYLEEIKANSGRFSIINAGINSPYSDYGSSFSADNKLVFASARDTGGVSKKVFKWTNQAFTNLYSAKINSEGGLENPTRFYKKINTKFNESTPVFTKDGKTMYFTRNNFLNGKRGNDSKNITLLKVYKATNKDGVWGNVVELPFNSDQYNVAHPCLNKDDSTLYFASDMPGTLGESDLFMVKIDKDGNFSKPENLGDKINTESRETFPFMSDENELYFASDGRPGLGGLDIFVSQLGKNNIFGECQNLGSPINGTQDDFAFLMNSDSRNGFFTSNRDGGLGLDDIYTFTENKKLVCKQLLTGLVTDQETGAVLAQAKVALFDMNFVKLGEATTDIKGEYTFDVVCKTDYYVRASQVDYETKEKNISIAPTSGKTELSLQLEKRVKPITVGTDLAKTLDIPIIYFDLDKSLIRKDAAFELEKLLAVMNQYPKMKIDVRSHTDSRQTAQYNLGLSNRRAKATMTWLVENGINANRLTGKGYGESQLINKCSDGVDCTETEHQANRRSEFIIVTLGK
jgi:outer membrane protein OmpA-like peptidoglycan-associated protein/tetratricopeptide (TPR) repeat protein